MLPDLAGDGIGLLVFLLLLLYLPGRLAQLFRRLLGGFGGLTGIPLGHLFGCLLSGTLCLLSGLSGLLGLLPLLLSIQRLL